MCTRQLRLDSLHTGDAPRPIPADSVAGLATQSGAIEWSWRSTPTNYAAGWRLPASSGSCTGTTRSACSAMRSSAEPSFAPGNLAPIRHAASRYSRGSWWKRRDRTDRRSSQRGSGRVWCASDPIATAPLKHSHCVRGCRSRDSNPDVLADPALSLRSVAKALECNPKYLTSRFSRVVGERVPHARRRLAEGVPAHLRPSVFRDAEPGPWTGTPRFARGT